MNSLLSNLVTLQGEFENRSNFVANYLLLLGVDLVSRIVDLHKGRHPDVFFSGNLHVLGCIAKRNLNIWALGFKLFGGLFHFNLGESTLAADRGPEHYEPDLL